EVDDLIALIERRGAVKSQPLSIYEIHRIERGAIRQETSNQIPTIERGIFQFLPIFQNLIPSFELHRVGIAGAKLGDMVLDSPRAESSHCQGHAINSNAQQVQTKHGEQAAHPEPIHKLLLVSR